MTQTALDWAPPPSQTPATDDATPAPFARPLLDTPAGELALFRSLITHRLVGPNKHFDMVAVLLSLQRALASEEGGEEAVRGLRSEDVWSKWRELYDQQTLESVWEEQQEQLLPTPTPSPTPDTPDLSAGTVQPVSTPFLTTSSRVTSLHFPRRSFDLSPETSVQVAAFQRGLVPKGSKHESPIPDDAPLREVSVPLPEGDVSGETSGRGKRKKRAGGAAGGSPRKKQKVDKKPPGGEEEDSELSELSEEADEEAEESGEEGGEGDEEAEEDVEEDDGTSVGGTAATVDDDSASTATEADAKRKPADKAAAIRSLPSSNRRSRTSNAKERQDSTPASSDAGVSTPAKKGTRSTAKTLKKEEAAPASAPRSSRRRR
ncbi:hypothetical protein Rt10032_c13g5064 [Rhodotorula toruloides]|uniref:Proteophosphoglycan ppg4 n=1 Tax=Rhodotorula toruloides TaxID=5286 RepID=A0A511KKZ6_RHOTO|nr:hypothetical protein Rt10032_c13g5064 [Rhodotorula toruloides]